MELELNKWMPNWAIVNLYIYIYEFLYICMADRNYNTLHRLTNLLIGQFCILYVKQAQKECLNSILFRIIHLVCITRRFMYFQGQRIHGCSNEEHQAQQNILMSIYQKS